ncbi:hypothetical protein DRO35_04630 [Candidatus Bathyarchaeota archaeon]|nr:MAG: hypothetical protein DRO35_04630 [Candidatus Bathyarchaeota archaeon]
MKVKVAHVTPYFPPNIGGVETYVYELTRRLRKYCDVVVFTCGRGVTERFDGVTVHRIRAIDIRDMPLHLKIPYPIPPTLLSHVARSDADIIHVHGHAFATSFEGALAARITKKSLVMTIHDVGVAYMDYAFVRGLRPIVDSIFVQMSINWSDVVIAQNFTTHDYVLKFKPRKVIIIPQGVDTEKFKPVKIKGEYVTFIAARLVKLKGDETFIKAIPLVLKERKDAKFRIVGGGHRRKYLEELAKKFGVLDKIEFTGPVPHKEVPKYLAEANIVACPGAPAGLILLEAAAMKKPIITVPHKWSVESLGKTAYYIPPNNPKKLANAIIYLMNNPEVSRMLVEAAHRRVVSRMSWETVTLKHLEIYRELLKKGKLRCSPKSL